MNFLSLLPVADLQASVRYYRDALGFELGWSWPEGTDPDDPGEPSIFVYVFRGHFELFLRLCPPPVHPVEIMVGMRSRPEVDQIAEAHIAEPPEARCWGTYEMVVRDADGHILRVLN